MPIARSRLTSQGQVSIPAEVRRRLGVAPGAVVEWDDAGGDIVLCRAGRFSSEDVHRALFPEGVPSRRSIGTLKAAIRQQMRKKHARR